MDPTAGMGPLYEPEYLSIINPSAVIDNVKAYRASDGSSRMASFNDSLTVQELLDLVAIRNLAAPSGSAGHGEHKR